MLIQMKGLNKGRDVPCSHVDNYLHSFVGKDTAIKHVMRWLGLLKKNGFHITEWIFDCLVVLEVISAKERRNRTRRLYVYLKPTEHTFEVQRDAGTGEFIVKLNIPSRSPKRRGILSSVRSLHDRLLFVPQ